MNNSIVIPIHSTTEELGLIRVYDLLGNLIRQVQFETSASVQNILLPVNDQPTYKIFIVEKNVDGLRTLHKLFVN